MANKTILMTKIRQILRLFTLGKSKVQISEQCDKLFYFYTVLKIGSLQTELGSSEVFSLKRKILVYY
jgi:hypothetical protein